MFLYVSPIDRNDHHHHEDEDEDERCEILTLHIMGAVHTSALAERTITERRSTKYVGNLLV